MIWILDTSALFSRPLLRNLIRLRAWQDPVHATLQTVIPSIAYTERLRQIRRDKKDETHWKRSLASAGIQVEPFGREEADRLSENARDDASSRGHARDHLIRCHLHGNRVLVTDDQGAVFADLGPLRTRHAAQALEELMV